MKSRKLLFMALIVALAVPSVSFSMSADGLVQSGRNLSAGSLAGPVRATQDGSVGNQETHAKFQQAVRDGNVYTCANPQATPVTTQAGLSATTPALVLWNPVGSPKNLVLWEDSLALNAAPAAASIFSLAVTTGPITTTTSGSVFNNLLNSAILPGGQSATPVGQCYRVSTLNGPPVAIRYIGQVTGAASLTQTPWVDNVDGKIVLTPGTGITFQTTTAAAVVGSFTWEEILP